jgi:hypothetical protein
MGLNTLTQKESSKVSFGGNNKFVVAVALEPDYIFNSLLIFSCYNT